MYLQLSLTIQSNDLYSKADVVDLNPDDNSLESILEAVDLGPKPQGEFNFKNNGKQKSKFKQEGRPIKLNQKGQGKLPSDRVNHYNIAVHKAEDLNNSERPRKKYSENIVRSPAYSSRFEI